MAAAMAWPQVSGAPWGRRLAYQRIDPIMANDRISEPVKATLAKAMAIE